MPESLKDRYLRSRKPEMGEVVDYRIKESTYNEVLYVISENGITEKHTDIVMEVYDIKLIPGVWLVRLASGKDALASRNSEGKLIPAAVAVVLPPGTQR